MAANNSTMRTGLVYHPAMTEHRNVINPLHPETAERVSEPWRALRESGLTKRCTEVQSRPATDEEILRVHSDNHLAVLSLTKHLSQDEINKIAICYNSIFLNEHSFTAARLAAGSVVSLTEAVVGGQVENGMAIVRPPGHHAETTLCMGFCLLNSVAIAAQHAVDKLGLSRVLVVDWDIHHGNGTQKHFYEDNRVLYFSLHRYDEGEFFPGKDDANYDYIGSGNGAGYNVNVAWNWDSMGDTEYMMAFHHLLLPIATEFEPELVLVSCGFDAGEGDFIGGYLVSPACYAHMTRQLMAVANNRVVLALEGGYSISCISNSTHAVVFALLGDTPLPSLELSDPLPNAINSILRTGRALAGHWKILAMFDKEAGVDDPCNALPTETPESGRVPPSYGRSLPTMDLGEVISKLKSEIDAKDEEEPHSSEASPQTPQENSPQNSGVTDQKAAEEETSSTEKVEEMDCVPSSSNSSSSSSSGGSVGDGVKKQTAGGVGVSTQHKIIQTLAKEGHDSMFAVCPKTWCEHLKDHVKPLPPGGIDSTLPCESCGASQEPWVCLSCYHMYCGRYVKEHMVMHQDSSGHKIALSMADLSVWCYLCDSYLDNQVLNPAINSAHKSKFGHAIDGFTN